MDRIIRVLSTAGLAAGCLGAGLALYYWGYGDFVTIVSEGVDGPGEAVGHTGRDVGAVILLYAAALAVLLPGVAFIGAWNGLTWLVGAADMVLWLFTGLGALSLGILFALPALVFLVVAVLMIFQGPDPDEVPA